MKQMTRLIRKVIMLAVSFLIIGGAVAYFQSFKVQKQTNIPSALISHQIASIQELATSQYHYTNMGTFEDYSTWRNLKLPFTTKEFVVSYDGNVTASVNINDVKTHVKDKTIAVTLPQAHILSHQIDEKSLNVFNETSSVFNRLSIEDVYHFTDQQKEKIEREAIDKGLLEEATLKAQQLIQEVLQTQPDLKGYKVVFH